MGGASHRWLGALCYLPEKTVQNFMTPNKKKWYFRWWAIVAYVFIILFFIGSASSQSNTSQQAAPVTQAQKPVATQTQPTQPKTEEQTIGDIANNSLQGVSDISYHGVTVEKDDSDRPIGSKLVTVSFDVATFYNKDSLIRDTGKISSSVFQGVFAENPKIYDVIVWFYGDTTDAYGNKKHDVILTYTVDKNTVAKFNWANFDKGTLCNVLEQQFKATGSFDTGCKVLANIQ